MKFVKDALIFDKSDMPFVSRFGFSQAIEMVKAFRSFQALPFVFDTHQLAAFLGIRREELFALVRRRERNYQEVQLPKKHGGVRHLRVPNAKLRRVQRRILHGILCHLPISPYATAYHPGATLKANAEVHCGKRYLLKMDVKDFFPSIRFEQVYSAAFHAAYFPKQIGVMLTTLCCYRDVLPQGAPTSPALSNLVMKHFDDAMGNWCQKCGIAYTRYCDDITFSSDKPLYVAYTKAVSMLNQMGLELNDSKTCFLTSAARHTVTGLTVNDRTNVPSDYRRKLRQELHYVVKFGTADAILKGNRTAFMEHGKPQVFRYLDHLEGQILYVLQIRPEDAYFLRMRKMLREERFRMREAFYLQWHESPYSEIGYDPYF